MSLISDRSERGEGDPAPAAAAKQSAALALMQNNQSARLNLSFMQLDDRVTKILALHLAVRY